MYSRVWSGVLEGIEACMIQVEADISNGLPVFEMVGYLASEVKEAKERVRAALKNQGMVLPPKRITVNLSPADIRKSGSLYDLPVAAAVLLAINTELIIPEPVFLAGELGLNGTVRGVEGILPLLLEAAGHRIRVCIVPMENREETAMLSDLLIVGAVMLSDILDFFREWMIHGKDPGFYEKRRAFEEERERQWKERQKRKTLPEQETEGSGSERGEKRAKKTDPEKEGKIQGDHRWKQEQTVDFSEIRGQLLPRRAIEIAVAGQHNLLFTGPPGSGKSALAKRIPSIMPELTREEQLEITRIYSVSGRGKQKGLVTERPFRAPHYTISAAAMIGGGSGARPGEVSLAHKGVLFLDEFPEFDRHILELMRLPMEDGTVTVTRNRRSCVYPADFMLVAAMNPCPCGYFPDRNRCFCTDREIIRYQNKISGPMRDRIDLTVRVNPVSFEELRNGPEGESSDAIRKRVERARKIQRERFGTESYRTNSRIDGKGIEQYCVMTEESEAYLRNLFSEHEISARGYERILRLSRTIADLDDSEKIREEHIAEAAAFRLGNPDEKI